MSVKYKHSDVYSTYFCTFTCYEWMHLFDITNSYDLVYDWFRILQQDIIEIIGYVIMPNHLHCILHFPGAGFGLNKIFSNGKRFMAYEIINRLEKANDINTLKILSDALTEREKEKNNCIRFSEILLMQNQSSPKNFSFRN